MRFQQGVCGDQRALHDVTKACRVNLIERSRSNRIVESWLGPQPPQGATPLYGPIALLVAEAPPRQSNTTKENAMTIVSMLARRVAVTSLLVILLVGCGEPPPTMVDPTNSIVTVATAVVTPTSAPQTTSDSSNVE